MNRREALQSLVALPGVGLVKSVTPKPDELLIIECDRWITPEDAERVHAMIKEHFGPEQRFIIFNNGTRIRFEKDAAIW